MAKFSDELFQAALRPRQVIRKHPFPGAPGVEVGVKLLSDAESDNARLQAVDYCLNRKANLIADPEFLDRAIHREVVSRAFYDPEIEDHAFFASQDDVAQLDNQTVRSLYELYNLHAVSMDPHAHCSLEEVDELGKSLVESANPAGLLNLLDADTLRNLLLSTVLKLREMERGVLPTPK